MAVMAVEPLIAGLAEGGAAEAGAGAAEAGAGSAGGAGMGLARKAMTFGALHHAGGGAKSAPKPTVDIVSAVHNTLNPVQF